MKNGLLRPEHARVLNLLRDFAPVGLERFGHGCRFRITRPALRHLARMGWATFEENALTRMCARR